MNGENEFLMIAGTSVMRTRELNPKLGEWVTNGNEGKVGALAALVLVYF